MSVHCEIPLIYNNKKGTCVFLLSDLYEIKGQNKRRKIKPVLAPKKIPLSRSKRDQTIWSGENWPYKHHSRTSNKNKSSPMCEFCNVLLISNKRLLLKCRRVAEGRIYTATTNKP